MNVAIILTYMFKRLKKGIRKMMIGSLCIGLLLGIALTATFTYFISGRSITLTCTKGGTVGGIQDVMIWKCDEPAFSIGCNLKTFSNINGVKKCSTVDGIRYKLLGNFSS
jgi:hypothetical protein